MSTRAAAAEATRERIAAVAADEFSSQWYDEVTLRDVAESAGVALQTVRNHFDGKEELFAAAVEHISKGIVSVRWGVSPGDVDGAITTLVDDYERTGEANLRIFAVEPRVAVARPLMDRAREKHQEWVEFAFADALTGLRGRARSRRIAQLVVATDIYTWKLLRKDKGLDREETIKAICELVLALNHNTTGDPR